MTQSESENANKNETKETQEIKETEIEKPEDLKKALAEEKNKCEANFSRWQRAQADFLNYKRYAEQDKAETCKFANAGLLAVILPVLDDLERALATLPADEANQKWAEGFQIIGRKFKDILQKQGVTQIQALGMEFDPHVMDAVTCAKGKKDMVIQELERGYKLNDRVIRPAKVVVGTGEDDAIKEE